MINVTKSYLPAKQKLFEYIERIYASGWLTNNGALCQELENKLKHYLGVDYLVLVNNGTLALQIAFKALNLTGEVITTPFSFVATTSSLVWEGLKPVFADIDPTSFTIDPQRILPLITAQTSAILPVHVYGNACQVDVIAEMARKFNLKVIYDAAHAFNVQIHNQSLLQYGDIATLSFHATKLFHTIEGGAIITKDLAIYKKVKNLINFGITGPDKVEGLGINAKMNEFQAAMGLCILEDMETILEGRKQVTERYDQLLPQTIRVLHFKQSTNNYAYYPVLFQSEEEVLAIQQALQTINVNTRRYFYPSLNTLDYLETCSCPISEDIASRILSLPLYFDLELSKVTEICNQITKTLNTFKEKIC